MPGPQDISFLIWPFAWATAPGTGGPSNPLAEHGCDPKESQGRRSCSGILGGGWQAAPLMLDFPLVATHL